MAAKIQAAIPGTKVDLIKGSKGAFTVTVDGRELWNKHQTGEFPDEDQLVNEMRRNAGAVH